MISCSAWLVSLAHGGDARASCVVGNSQQFQGGYTNPFRKHKQPSQSSASTSLHTHCTLADFQHLSFLLPPHPTSRLLQLPSCLWRRFPKAGLGTAPAVLFLGSCQGLAFSEGQEDNAPSILPVSEGLLGFFSPCRGWIGGCTSPLPLWEEEGRVAC